MWIIATYHCYFSIGILAVANVNGSPKADWHPTSARGSFYTWNSYHAARKFQRAHRCLRGYVILSLSEIEKQFEEAKKIDDEDGAFARSVTATVPAIAESVTRPAKRK